MTTALIDITAVSLKRCTRCGEEWPGDTEFYHREARQRDGMTKWCKACWNEYQKERYEIRKGLVA